MPFLSESLDIQSLFLWYRKSLIMTSCSVTSFKRAISEILEIFYVDSNSEKSDPLFPAWRPSKASGRSSVSNIHLDDVVIPSGLPSMSRRFELFRLASVRTSWQHVWMLFRVREDYSASVHPSGRRGYTVRTPVRVRGELGFPSQTQMWEDSCNRLDDKSTPFEHYPW
jgi:hypothetical protein